jgi:Sec-independent protein translocase protein TatA
MTDLRLAIQFLLLVVISIILFRAETIRVLARAIENFTNHFRGPRL